MMRWLVLLVTLPLWLPFRLIGWLRFRLATRSVLHVMVSGLMPDVPAQRGLLGLLRRPGHVGMLRLLEALEAAGNDPKVSTVLVQVEHLACGLSRAEELRNALSRLRAAGKEVIVHADELGLSGYWIALGASSIRLPESGGLTVSGIEMEFTLLKGLLDRAGIRAQLLARGKYKSMREMFAAPSVSPENREMMASLVTDLSGQLVGLIASARGKSLDDARADLDAGPFRAEEAITRGLIDAAQYWDQLWAELGGDSGKVLRLDHYDKLHRRRHVWPRRGATIALLRISGNIRSGHDRQGPSGPRATGSQSLRRALRQVTKSSRVRALVVRVDSPGGSALASDLMWRELTLAAAKKPTFVSMVNVAASGGYYTSGIKGVPVWASPTTLTGSIGVVGGKFEISGLLAKLGVSREVFPSGPRAGFHSPTRAWDASDLEKVERDMDALYRDFVAKMADARGTSFEAMHEVAQGRVWTGRQARDAGLVDHLGGFYDVERAVRQRLGIRGDVALRWTLPTPERKLRPPPDSDAAFADAETALSSRLEPLAATFPEVANAVETALDLPGSGLWALCPILPRRGR